MSNNHEKIKKLLDEVREISNQNASAGEKFSQFCCDDEVFNICVEKLEAAQELYYLEFSRLVKKETGWEF